MMAWWHERNAREQLLLKGLAAVAALIILFQFVYAPIKSYRDGALASYQNATALLAEMEEGAARAAAAPLAEGSTDDGRSVRVVATELAREMGVTITRLSPSEEDGLTVWLDGTEGPLMFRWLLRLRDEHGVRVRRAAIHKGNAAGLVAEFTLGRA